MPGFERSNRILVRKFIQYLIPTMITTAAISLNEFVDSMLAASLLGSKAMAVITLGTPTAMLLAGIYTLLGNGGATLYASCLGSRETVRAGRCFRASMITALIAGIAVPVLGFSFFHEIASLLCRNDELMPDFIAYFRIQLYSAPLLVFVLTLVEFFTPSGKPSFATAVITTANGVNLIMDYVYMGVLNMGVQGAAWATFTGYVAGLGLIALFYITGSLKIRYSGGETLDVLRDAGKIGASPALSQLSFAPRYAVTNALAAYWGGTAGIVAFSLCCQMLSVVSIFLAAILGTSVPLVAVLHGQKDYIGKAYVLSVALKAQLVMSVICIAFAEIFAEGFAAIYSINDPAELEMSVKALRIFSLMFLFRSAYMVIMKYWQASGKNLASFVISMLDGFAGIIPIMFVMSMVMGITGIWWGYVLNSVLILAGTALYFVKLKPSSGDDSSFFEATIILESESISGVTAKLEDICRRAGADASLSLRSALALEEIAVYTRNHIKKDSYMDITARSYPDRIEIDFRTLGEPFDPMSETIYDMPENMKFLRSLSPLIEHDYIMGMNCTRISITKRGDKR